jgi:DNA primase
VRRIKGGTVLNHFGEQPLDEIKRRLDIAEVIGRYVRLKKAGKNLVGLCPFHQEKTPSFSVNVQEQFYHCFGCKESGDIFTFIMKMEGCEFPEALERLAAEAGVRLNKVKVTDKRKKDKDELYKVNQQAAEYFRSSLQSPAGRACKAYLKSRKINDTSINRFGLGYAPGEKDGLLKYLISKGITEEQTVQAGLAVRKEGRQTFDLFRNRLMFPIVDAQGRVVGFGGRIIGTDQNAKYINSPQTLLFNKSRLLYGLFQAKNGIRRRGEVIVCEGYTDVIALAQVGVENAVASLGTAFTHEQALLLKRWAKEVVLCFDADFAGHSATDRGLDILAEEGLDVKVALLPEGEDPDSLVNKRGLSAIEKYMKATVSLTEYKIEEILRSVDINSIEGKAKAVRRMAPILVSINSAVAREGYIAEVSSRIGSSIEAIIAEIQALKVQGGKVSADKPKPRRFRNNNTDDNSLSKKEEPRLFSINKYLYRHEMSLLKLLLIEPGNVEKVIRVLGKTPFRVEKHNQLLEALSKGRSIEDLQVDSDEDFLDILRRINDFKIVDGLDVEACINRLWIYKMRNTLRELEKELLAMPETGVDEYAEKIGRLLQIYRQIRKERQKIYAD